MNAKLIALAAIFFSGSGFAGDYLTPLDNVDASIASILNNAELIEVRGDGDHQVEYSARIFAVPVFESCGRESETVCRYNNLLAVKHDDFAGTVEGFEVVFKVDEIGFVEEVSWSNPNCLKMVGYKHPPDVVDYNPNIDNRRIVLEISVTTEPEGFALSASRVE